MKSKEFIKKISGMDEKSLTKEAADISKDIRLKKLEISANKSNKTADLKRDRKNLARVKTILSLRVKG